VLGVAGRAGPDVAGEHAGQEPLSPGTVDPVLEQGRRVEDRGAVANGEVLGLLGQLIFRRDEVTRPVLPQAGLVEHAEALVEGSRADHRGAPLHAVLPGEAAHASAYWTAAQYRLRFVPWCACPPMTGA